jgi:4-hydroxybenzoate polyprenyltransferase
VDSMKGLVSTIDIRPKKVPICVDLDGTLVFTNMLAETALSAIRKNIFNLFLIPFWVLKGRAFAKKKLAESSLLDPSLLPYNKDLIVFLNKERENGRKLFLATASDKQVAISIADHLNIFDGIIASDGNNNLKGKVKSLELLKLFGEKAFIYAGNDISDLHVWENAQSAITVNTSQAVSKAVREFVPVIHEFSNRKNILKELFRALRTYQWIKNILVFVPLIVTEKPINFEEFISTCLIFISFCLSASGLYLINDIMDLETDRRHPFKRRRPFASGLLPLEYVIISPIMITAALYISRSVSIECLMMVSLYILVSVLYSVFFKTKPLIDLFCLAGLYTLRIIAGGFSSGAHVSIWLLNFSGFFFLALALLKRYTEYFNKSDNTDEKHSRRAYNNSDREMLQMMGIGSSLIAAVVLGLYISSSQATSTYKHPEYLWGIIPVIVFWHFRLWFAAGRNYMHHDPIIYSLKDWVSYICFALIAGIFIFAKANI